MSSPKQAAGAKYVRRTIYLRRGLAFAFRRLAVGESWQLADLARIMIITGLTVRELLKAQEHSEHKLIALEALNQFSRDRPKRAYRPRTYDRKGEWITVHLPAGFLTHVATYAKVNGYSQNEALAMFLRDGMRCYLAGRKRFLRALRVAAGEVTSP